MLMPSMDLDQRECKYFSFSLLMISKFLYSYEALYESSGPNPDFHRLEKFQPIDFQYLVPDNKEAKLSDIWESSIAGKED